MKPSTTDRRLIAAAALAVLVIAVETLRVFKYPLFVAAALMINYARSLVASPGTLMLEMAPGAPDVALLTTLPAAAIPESTASSPDWPSYNRALTSMRYSPLDQINRDNVAALRVLCTYDTKEKGRFTTGPIELDGALIGTTDRDIFSIDATTCRENWRTHEHYTN